MSQIIDPEAPQPAASLDNREANQADNDVKGTEQTPTEVKKLTQTLLRQGFIEEARHATEFRRAATRQTEINAALEALDLSLHLDEQRGIAFLVVAESGFDEKDEAREWSHPLVRRQRLTLEQSILVALLRQRFVLHEQEAGIGTAPPQIPLEELLADFRTYFGDSGSDAKDQSRLASLLDQLKTCGIVSEVDKNEEITIRPLIAHFANPETLANLLGVLEAQVRDSK